jgi:hypothetical protein
MWVYFGNKESKVEEIRSVTGIGADILAKNSPLSKYCIATGMSWAADRRATRLEDLAHSLMGIFGVNMPLLYGEGKKAFSRLQEEMIRRTTDVTFLLWGFNNMTGDLLLNAQQIFETYELEISPSSMRGSRSVLRT